MKTLVTTLALAIAAAAPGAHAQSTTYAATGLVASPNPLTMTGRGGLSYFRTITVTNYGPGFARDLNAVLTRISGTTGDFSDYGDTCTGATLAVGGTCTIKVVFDAGCPYAGSVRYNLTITSTTMPTVVDVITGNTQAGICQ